MTLDLDTTHAKAAYPLLASLVTPRPIAWVTTLNPDQSVNLAPFSFFNVMGANPPIVAFAPGNKDADTPKDTARNIRTNREFVIHTVDEPLGAAMAQSATSLRHGESEIDAINNTLGQDHLTLAPSESITVPRLAQAPVAFECREHSTLHIGANRLVIGTVHRIHVRDGLLDPETLRLLPGTYAPIGRMASPDWYCKTEETFQI